MTLRLGPRWIPWRPTDGFRPLSGCLGSSGEIPSACRMVMACRVGGLPRLPPGGSEWRRQCTRRSTTMYTAIIEKEGNLYAALCPELDVVSQGTTVEEAASNLQE